MNIEEIIEAIKGFCYNFESFPNTHKFFQTRLVQLLRSKGCLVNREHEILFDCVKVNGDVVRRRGFIDLLAFFKGKKIAIEFDQGYKLKLKSISKLLQVDANIRIGIIRGNQTYNVWRTNKNRIAYSMRRLRILKKPILLIINSQKSASWIYPMF